MIIFKKKNEGNHSKSSNIKSNQNSKSSNIKVRTWLREGKDTHGDRQVYVRCNRGGSQRTSEGERGVSNIWFEQHKVNK